ncbi:MAG: hypothetical protein DMD58_15540, partial [Gemmatimonadetes bacterium]
MGVCAQTQGIAMRPLIAASLALQFLYPLAAQGQARPPSTDASPPAAPAAAAVVGAEYPEVIDRAWRGVGMGISVAFAYEVFGRLQGRARVEHHRVLLALLRHLGDDRFALALSSQSPVGHAAILRALRAAASPDSLGLPDLRLDPFPDNPPVVLPPSAPPHVTVIVQVTASGRVDTSLTTVLSMPHADSATTSAIKTTLATWRFTPGYLRGCALAGSLNLDLEGPASSAWPVGAALGHADSTQGALSPGLYLGPWNDEVRTHWLVLFVGAHGRAVTYDPPTLVSVCSLRREGPDSISLQTEMREASSGMDLRLLIRGSPTASGISGNLRRVGWQGRQSGAI